MITVFSRKRASSLALAIALATGSAVVATAVFPAEANAQRRERERDRGKQEESAGGGYSDEFRAAYVPLDEAMKAPGSDLNALKPQLQALVPLLKTSDEKIAGGGMIFNTGIQLQDPVLQLQGMEIMLSSGLVPAENLGRYNFIAYQLANQQDQIPKSRTYLQAAIDNNFTTDEINASSLRIQMAESYFSANELDAGFDYLRDAIRNRKAQGQAIDERWYRRGVTVAYENQSPAVYDFVTMWLADYPSASNWRDAINIARNLNRFTDPEILDLFRLGRRVDALQDASDYDYYVEAADPRRLPKEVKDVIEEGLAAGVVNQGNLFITEALEVANGRIAADRSDLPSLERDAMAASAELRTVVAAGNAFLSYEDYAKAAQFFERALAMPGVETNEVRNRLAIAQIGMGDYAAAEATLENVSGSREVIAKLWAAYADQLAGQSGGSAAAGATGTMADSAM